MIEAVVFDMDGILFDTERLSVECWRQTAREMGLGDIEKGVYGCIGLNRTDSRLFMKQTYGEDFPYEEFRARNSALFRERVEREGLPVMEGAGALLEWLAGRGIPTALASSTAVNTVKSHLERADFSHYFQVVIGGDMVEHSKPQPDIYCKACSLLGTKPERTAAVEDSPNGIRSAYGAGMLPIMVPDLVQPGPELEKLLYRKCDSLRDVLELLKKEIL